MLLYHDVALHGLNISLATLLGPGLQAGFHRRRPWLAEMSLLTLSSHDQDWWQRLGSALPVLHFAEGRFADGLEGWTVSLPLGDLTWC